MKRVIAFVGTAVAFFILGLFAPQWVALFNHKQDLRRIAAHCNNLASKQAEDAVKTVFRQCFDQNIAGLAEAAEGYAAQRAGELARRLD
jgi:hypothetical protein